jgi:hypothetical protein
MNSLLSGYLYNEITLKITGTMKAANHFLFHFRIQRLWFIIIPLMIFACGKETIETETTPTSGVKKDSTGIPEKIGIFCPINKDAKRDASGKFPSEINKWYQEINGTTQEFKLFAGDSVVRGSDPTDFHARTEAGGNDIPVRFSEGSDWYKIEYTMKIKIPKSTNGERLKETMTISQLFAGCCGPQFRLELNSKGGISYGSRSNGNGVLLSDKDYSDGNTLLKVKMLSNGKFMKLFLNDKQINFTVDGKTGDMIQTEESKKGTANVLYHYRWGLYYNTLMYKDISSTVTNIVSKKM